MNRKLATGVAILAAVMAVGCGKASKPPQYGEVKLPPKEEADKLLGEMTAYIMDDMWESTDRTLTRLDELKPNLPTEYGAKIEQARKDVASAKAKAKK